MSNLYYSALIPFFYLKHLLSVTLDMDADFVKFSLVFNNFDTDANWYSNIYHHWIACLWDDNSWFHKANGEP